MPLTSGVASSSGALGGTGGVTTPTVGQTLYPNQQTAPLTQQQIDAMNSVNANAGTAQGLADSAASAQLGAINSTGTAQGTLGSALNTTNSALNSVNSATPGTQNFLNTTMGEQGYIAGGGLLSPSSNPYLSQYYNAAAAPMIQNYEQAVAPNILQQAAQSGTLGSAGMGQAFGNAETALAQGLGTLGANIYEPAYQAGVTATNQAAANAPSLAGAQYLPSQQLSNIANQQANIGLGQSSVAGQTGSLAQGIPGIQQSLFTPSNELFQSGQVGQQQAQNVLNSSYNNLYNQANWPVEALNMLGAGLGMASGGGSSGTSISSGPMGGSGK